MAIISRDQPLASIEYVTRESLADGSHPVPMLDAMRILLAQPLPNLNTQEGCREQVGLPRRAVCRRTIGRATRNQHNYMLQARRERTMIVIGDDIKSVAEIMLYYNVCDCTDIEYDAYDLELMDRGLDALFDKISEEPGNVHVVVLPGGDRDITMALKADFYVDMTRACVGWESCIGKIREHLIIHEGVDMATYVIFREDGDRLLMKAYVPVEVHHPNTIVVELEEVTNREQLRYYTKFAPSGDMPVVVSCARKRKYAAAA